MLRSLDVGEGGLEAGAVEGILFDAIDNMRRSNADDVVDGRDDVVDVGRTVAGARNRVLSWPATRPPWMRSTEVRGEKLRSLVENFQPAPASVVHVVSFGRPKNIRSHPTRRVP